MCNSKLLLWNKLRIFDKHFHTTCRNTTEGIVNIPSMWLSTYFMPREIWGVASHALRMSHYCNQSTFDIALPKLFCSTLLWTVVNMAWVVLKESWVGDWGLRPTTTDQCGQNPTSKCRASTCSILSTFYCVLSM